MSPRFAGSEILLLLTHSFLRCGLEEYRQLRWLSSFPPLSFLARP